MSYLYDNPEDQAKLSDTLDRLPQVAGSPGLFGNFWESTGFGLARGGLKLGQLGTYWQDPDTMMAQQLAASFEGKGRDVVKEDQDARAAARVMLAKKAQELTPNPLITGIGSHRCGGFAEILPTAIGGTMLGGPVLGAGLVGGAQGVGDYQESRLQGIDEKTAAQKATLTGVTAGVGTLIPMSRVGSGLLTNMGIGAGVNLVTGGIQRGGTAAILKAGGYKDQAAQYRILDGEAILIDTVLGLAFGGFGHITGKPAPEKIDAALKLNERQHVEVEGQPGIHNTPESRQQGTTAFEETLHGLLDDGRAPDVTGRAAAMDLTPNPAHEILQREVGQVITDHLGEVGERLPVQVEGAALGHEAAVKIAGRYYPTQWALVDADKVAATLTKDENQFRDRTRAASEVQIGKIAGDPDFNLLGHAPIMDFGAPTLTRDGKIIGGNGRFAGVSKAYDIGTGEKYAGPLRENLARFGIDPKAAQGMKKPVLVRVLQTDVDVAKAAMASNEGAGLRMSALEQAKVDSARLGDLRGFDVSETGDLNGPANLGHIRQWLGQFPTEEASGLVDKAGQLSAEGAVRLRNAVLFRAYGDSPTLARLVESTDPGARNVATALLRTAPAVAEAKASIAEGGLYPLDISGDIAQAIETLDGLRRNGMKVSEYLDQGQMFGSELSVEARRILQFFGENMRSARAMSDLIAHYYENLHKAGDPNQGSMFAEVAPTKAELLDAAIADTGKTLASRAAELPFGREGIGATLERRIRADFDGVARKYASLEESRGGQILNTDIARELSPEYRADRTRSADVHEAASQFVKDLYARKLAEPTPEGMLPQVLFTGGGTGAGKSSGLELLGNVAKVSEIVYDTNMNKLASSVTKIEQALAAGRDVVIVYTFRDPVDALRNGALPRAMRMGRTVPLDEHAKTHVGSREVIDQLAEKYADDPRVTIHAIDNSRGKDKAQVIPIAEIPTLDHNGLEAKLHETAREEHQAGRISDHIYRGTAGKDAAEATRGADRAGTGRQPEQVRDGAGREAGGQDLAREAAVDPNAIVQVDAINPATGKTERVSVTAGEALRDNADRLQKMKGLLACLQG